MAFSGVGDIKKTTTEGDILSGNYHVATVRWVEGVNAGDRCVLQNARGEEVWRSQADGAYFTDVHAHFGWVEDLTVQTLDSGVLLVYIL